MLIPRSVLAARKCGDTDSKRYALGGLCLTRHNDTPYAVATDGRKLVALTWQEPTVGSATGIDLTPRPGCEFIIPTAALDKVAACKIGTKSRNELHRFIGVEEPADEKVCTAPMMATDGDETARFEPKLQEGRFPRWRDVVPAPRTDDVTFCCDARYLIQLLEAITAHTGNNENGAPSVVFSINPSKSHIRPIVISASNPNGNKAIGVLMPLAADEKDRPANRWQVEADAAEVAAPADEPPPPRTRAERKAAAAAEPIAAPEVVAVDPPAEIPADEPAPAPADEPEAPATTEPPPPTHRPRRTRELATAGSRDNWEAGNY